MPTNEEAGRQVPKEALWGFLNHFVAYVKSKKLYPPGHNRLVRQIKLFTDSTQTIFSFRDEIPILIQPETITVCGMPFGKDEPTISGFAPEFVKRLIRYIVIEKGVTREDLNAFADLLMLDPVELQEAGGAVSMLNERQVTSIFLFEFSFDMESFIRNEEDLITIRSLARYDHGQNSEPYIMKRMKDLNLNDEDRERLNSLMRDNKIQNGLSSLHSLFGEMPAQVKEEVHSSDLLLYLLSSISDSESSLEKLGDSDVAQIISHILEEIHQRFDMILKEKSNLENLPRRDLLDQVARETTSTPESLLRWLSLDEEQLGITLSADQAVVLKAIFSLPETGQRRISFGKSRMEVLESPDSPDNDDPGDEQVTLNPGSVALAELRDRYLELKKGLRDDWLTLAEKPCLEAYMDTLFELHRMENDRDARERILVELETFLEQQLARIPESDYQDPWFQRIRAELTDHEAACVLLSPKVCEHVLKRYAQGEEEWKEPLQQSIQNQISPFVRSLGSLLTDEDRTISTEKLEEFIPLCQEKLVNWLINHLTNQKSSYPIQKVITILQYCKTPRIVPLVDLLFKEMEPTACLPLAHRLMEIDNNQSIRVVISLLDNADGPTREAILGMLGESKQAAAEQTLLRVVDCRTTWKEDPVQERMAALQSLEKCGTAQSVDLLRRLSTKWSLLFTKRGRVTRTMATDALIAVNERLMAGRR